MSKTTVEQTLKLIPSLFEINLNNDKCGKCIFDKLSQILDFDEAFIYFLNPESLQLKYSFKDHNNYKINSIYEMTASLKKQMFSKEGKLLLPDSDFIKTVGLAELKKKSYILAKISVKSTVFGVILLAKKEHNFYNEEDLTILDASASILSYILKDLELSNVFKIQLKALKDGIIEKQEAYKKNVNFIYTGCTRAKDELTIILSAKRGESVYMDLIRDSIGRNN